MKHSRISSLVAVIAVLLFVGFSLSAVNADDNSPSKDTPDFSKPGFKKGEGASKYQTKPEQPSKPLTKEEKSAVRAKARLAKKIASVFKRADLVKTKRSERRHVDDYFVVAKFEMPLATREAELRFEVTEGVDKSTDKVADYLFSTPQKTMRDYRVVSRFKSEEDAEAGLLATRKRYDAYLEYQAKLLAYLAAEKAKSLRRC